MSKLSLIALCRSAAIAAALGSCLVACRKDEPPPPLPVAAPKAPEPVAEAPLELKPEDAGRPPAPAAPPPKATGKKSGGLAACCAALRQNAVNAPEPNKGYMTTAAGVCDFAATQGQDKASVVASIRAALKTAGMPTDCK